VASETENRTARTLAVLGAMGFVQLADRRWPGSDKANVDLVVVGPSGVFVVDTKCWAEPSVQADRMFRGQEDVTEELVGLADLAEITRSELVEIGLAPGEVMSLAVLAGRRGIHELVAGVTILGEHDVLSFIARRGQRLTDVQVDQVVARCLTLFPPMSDPAASRSGKVERERDSALDGRILSEPVLPAPEPLDEGQLCLLSSHDVQQALLEGALLAPIEEWMTFVHPDQAREARRTHAGPARIRGAAGTGKTVVGLHRAAYLAGTRPGRILYTSFVKTLPVALRETFRRMAPQHLHRMEFVGIHAFAQRLLRERGHRMRLDTHAVDAAFAQAWSSASGLKDVAAGQQYWREEIDHVIKGRGITRFEEYLALPRLGRRHRLGPVQRRAVWDLYGAYQQQLDDCGLHDFNDLLLHALASIQREPLQDGYSSIIVDEVQDLPCVAVRLLHALVGDRTDGLLLIGDGQQAVYPGGFTLAEVGVDVRGRATVLRENYRNTVQILEVAKRVVSGDAYGDLDDLEEVGDRDVRCVRQGDQPVRVDARTAYDHDLAMLASIERASCTVGVGLGDLAVLVPSTRLVREYIQRLGRAGIDCMDLYDYDGTSTEKVKIGTYHRAKGLEFKHVFLPRLEDQPRSRRLDESEGAHRERVELARRQLFVGMTRARDGLWLGYLSDDGPSAPDPR